MLATPERIPGYGRTPDQTVWHKPADGHRCTGSCDFHPIACSPDEVIVFPASKRQVSLRLDDPGGAWCAACLALLCNKNAVEK